jgi:hypothetical protein
MKEKLLKVWAWIRKYLIAPLPIILVVAGAVILVALGAKNVQIGGILAKLTGKKTDGKKAVRSPTRSRRTASTPTVR